MDKEAKFKIGDGVKVKEDCPKGAYGTYGIVTGMVTLLDPKYGEYIWQYQVAWKDREYDYLYFFEGELEHSAWNTKLGELL